MQAIAMFDAVHGIPLGIPVYDAAGEKIGRVRWVDALGLSVEQGWLFPKESEIPLDEVDRFQDGKLILRCTKAELRGLAA